MVLDKLYYKLKVCNKPVCERQVIKQEFITGAVLNSSCAQTYLDNKLLYGLSQTLKGRNSVMKTWN